MINKSKPLKVLLSDIYLGYLGYNKDTKKRAMKSDDQTKTKNEQN